MDTKVEEMCKVIQSLGGDVCTENLHNLTAEDFADTGIEFAQQDENKEGHKAFDPAI
jgi:serine O-acetyltransferase